MADRQRRIRILKLVLSLMALPKMAGAAEPPRFLPPAHASSATSGGVVNLDALIPLDEQPIVPVGITTDTVPQADQVLEPAEPKLPPGARDGIFQKITFLGTWAPNLSNEPDALGVGDLETSAVFGFPLLRRDTPLLITPRFGAHLLDNAAALDLPSTLYDAAVEFRHLRKFGGGPFAMDAAVSVGYYSDFEIDSSDAIRVTGRGLGVYESSPATKWILGVAYVNRAGASVLPVAGVIYQPTDDVSWEGIFPRPRVAWRLPGSVTGDERWCYIGGEFGGGIWAIERPSTTTLDVVSYSDLRVLVGYERKIIGGLSRRFEFGYVFAREIDYESATPDVSLDDTIFVRAGATY